MKSEQTRKSEILGVARHLLAEKGYANTSMQDIAIACKFNAPNLYNYFPDKESILFEVIKNDLESTLDTIENALIKNSTKTPAERLRIWFRCHIRILVQPERRYRERSLINADINELTDAHRRVIIELQNKYDELLRDILRELFVLGHFSNADANIIEIFAASIIIRTPIWFSNDGEYSPDEVADMLWWFTINAAAAPKRIPKSLST